MSFTDPQLSSVSPTVTVDLGAPLGVRAVLSWQIDREIVGSVLPGNFRGRSGLTVGTADVTVANPGVSKTPWAKGTDRITDGGTAVLTAHRDGETWPLGTWLVAPQSGSLVSGRVAVVLREQQSAGRVTNLLPAVTDAMADPAWMIDTLARQAGYWSTPPPVESCILSLPLNGAMWAEVGQDVYTSIYPEAWGQLGGVTGPLGPWSVEAGFAPGGEYGEAQGFTWELSRATLTGGESLFITATVEPGGTLPINWPTNGLAGGPDIEIRTATHQVAVRGNPSQPWALTTYEPGLDPRHPHRVQVEVQRDGKITNPLVDRYVGIFGPMRARARSSHDAPWSPWAVDPSTRTDYVARSIWITSTAAASGVQFTTATDPALWDRVTCDIEPLGGVVIAPFLPSSVDAWPGLQQVAASWLAVVAPDAEGVLRGRGRDYLAGIGDVVETIDVGRAVEDLPWRIDPADAADRLTVSWSPVDVVDATPGASGVSPELWSANEAIRIEPGKTVEVIADLAELGFVSTLTQWLPAWLPNAAIRPNWDARFQRGGGGGQPPPNALEISDRQISAGRVLIRIRNTTSGVLYTVNDQGQPWLKLMGWRRMDQKQPQLIELGASAETAVAPLAIDLGRHVQRFEDARAIAEFIWSRVQEPGYRVTSVKVAANWARDVGQIVRLMHARSDLSTKALITKVSMTGEFGRTEQRLDLVLLVPTWHDFDAAWEGQTWDDFDAHWSNRTWDDFDTDPLSTGA